VFDLETATEELLLSPERVLLTALDAKGLTLERDTTMGGIRHHVVSLGIERSVVRSIGRLTTIGQGQDRLYPLPTRGQHPSSMMPVYLPEHRLLYASGVVVPDAFEPVFAAA